jgi:homoprotocatechuate degradation regulator HpaR
VKIAPQARPSKSGRPTGKRTRANEPRVTARSLPIALLRARETIMARFRPLVNDAGFTDQQWRVMRVLDEESPLDPTEIAERAGILMPSLSRILRSLEQNGFVERMTNPDDKRGFHMSITSSAKERLSWFIPRSNAIYEQLEKQYGKARMAELLDLLEDLADLRDQ